ncbi:MAG: hypothetical protein LUI85_05660 [Bacteroides sp.]|nr:hypothetical protein [Bacteroides sp.]
MKKLTKQIFDATYGGYIVMSRNSAKLLLSNISAYDHDSFYLRLLVDANYSEGYTQKGIVVKRGEIIINVQELMHITHWKRTKVYEELKMLEQEQLLQHIDDDVYGHYQLLMYEEHCGRAVRKEEHQPTLTPEENQTEKGFLLFFDFYHFTTETPSLDKEMAFREWKKLSMKERDEALRNVERYSKAITNRDHVKKACNYLRDKCFKF